MPAGRPTKYKPEYAEQAKHLCRLGATDQDLALAFKVPRETVSRWQTRHEDFHHAIKPEKGALDARVERSLYHRAMGYSHPDIDIRVVDGEIVQTPIIKHYPPDTAAMIFWLKNRQPEVWRDKRDVDYRGDAPVQTIRVELVSPTGDDPQGPYIEHQDAGDIRAAS